MWFIRALGEFENGMQVPVIADLGENFFHATTFFDYFSSAPTFDTYDLLLEKEPQITMEDILNAISEKEKEEVPFPIAWVSRKDAGERVVGCGEEREGKEWE